MVKISEIRNWLDNLRGHYTPLTIMGEEESREEISLYQEERDADLLGEISIPLPITSLSDDYEWRYFIDGSFHLIPIKTVEINGAHVPIHVAHIVVGATVRKNKIVRPYRKIDAIVLIAPIYYIKRVSNFPAINVDEKFTLNKKGDIYLKIKKWSSPDRIFVSDSAISLSLNRGLIIEHKDLTKIGLLRRKARDRALVLMRILELGLAIDIAEELGDDAKGMIVMDGPLALPFKYCRLVRKDLKRVMDINENTIGDKEKAYRYLRRLLGVVKNVYYVPKEGIGKLALRGHSLISTVYRFVSIISEEDYDKHPRDSVSRYFLSAYLNPRVEIKTEIYKYWSPLAGFIRLDIPIPAIVDLNEQWERYDFQPNLTNPNSNHYRAIQEILKHAVAERYPIPRSTSYRALTEYYPLFETEQWVKASLMDKYELRALFV
ncbi:MAG: hypothetical protein ACTSX9_06765 [Candidatus Njordarchaeales archaeon]